MLQSPYVIKASIGEFSAQIYGCRRLVFYPLMEAMLVIVGHICIETGLGFSDTGEELSGKQFLLQGSPESLDLAVSLRAIDPGAKVVDAIFSEELLKLIDHPLGPMAEGRIVITHQIQGFGPKGDIAVEKLYGMLHLAGGIDPGRNDIAGGIIHQSDDIGLANPLNPEGPLDVDVPKGIGVFSAIAVGFSLLPDSWSCGRPRYNTVDRLVAEITDTSCPELRLDPLAPPSQKHPHQEDEVLDEWVGPRVDPMGSSGAFLEASDIITTGPEAVPPPPQGSGIYAQIGRSLSNGLSGIDGLHQVPYQSHRPYLLPQLIEPLVLFCLLLLHPLLLKRTIDEDSEEIRLFVLRFELATFFVFLQMGYPGIIHLRTPFFRFGLQNSSLRPKSNLEGVLSFFNTLKWTNVG